MYHEDQLNNGERSFSLMQVDTLVPHQYLETIKRKLPLAAEQRLMLAVLADAIYCFQKYYNARGRKNRRLFEDTEAWIIGSGADWIFSFENICETAGLDPSCVRRGLMHWKQAMLDGSHPAPVPPGGGKRRLQKSRLRMAA